ncbi:MAG TPA: hypothetical protein VFT95_18870 [Micromonosporaceae bacterium]|nr:hypothetical protein [Micromonosporaceae bacterium]
MEPSAEVSIPGAIPDVFDVPVADVVGRRDGSALGVALRERFAASHAEETGHREPSGARFANYL